MVFISLNYFRHKEKQQKWHIALGDEGKVIAVLTDNILEIRTKRSEYATIAARTTGYYYCCNLYVTKLTYRFENQIAKHC